MARSSLLGINPAAAEPAGRDKASLGPGDSSDSGSDMAGLDGDDSADPGLPVDVALRDDQWAPLELGESLAASEGETGVRDGADIGVDRVFTPGAVDDDLPEDVDADASVDDAPQPGEEDGEGDEGDQEDPAAADRPRRARKPAPRVNVGRVNVGHESEEALPDAIDPAGHRPGRS